MRLIRSRSNVPKTIPAAANSATGAEMTGTESSADELP
ncbi:hypothetical protein FOCG_14714 [Fusarium oxysporum f. sp. radicis-lycopersici 26381]|uniref:Uncharacterized protein n=1 Tax=Fusarium oxysporum Fo47 TaxID=660027 RepID=W9JQT1_FUSOX|nr:hypothetical protein FOZG_14996 [Fusarium oxysporum Fo47]EXL43258.1 hypothetical protein FOCG_14714 [Fusarium oxysporum f. sp. radicis-lycopersici 26381]